MTNNPTADVTQVRIASDSISILGSRQVLVDTGTRDLPEDLERMLRGAKASPAQTETVEVVCTALLTDGVCLVDFSDVPQESPSDRTSETLWLHQLGEPFRVFAHHPLWKPIGVQFDVQPERAGGVGHNPLHIDFVNAELPPPIVGLLCVRPDPQGGGQSIVSSLRSAVDSLSSAARHTLSRRVFRDGRVENLMNVGNDANPFRVLDTNITRFTAKMINSTPEGSPERLALEDLARALEANERLISLQPRQLLLVNQTLVVHGRTALGPEQEKVPANQLRLVEQIFVRPRPRNSDHQPSA